MRQGRDFIARHGETVFNHAARPKGRAPHTPLTRAGCAQADAIGRAMRDLLGPRPTIEPWSSPAGRALTCAEVIAAPGPEAGVPIAAGLPQGSIVPIAAGVEAVVHRGTGAHGKTPA